MRQLIQKYVVIMDMDMDKRTDKMMKLRLRQKVVSRGRSELTRKIKNGTFIELNKTKHGIMDEKDIMLDREFFNDMVKEIEKSRLRSLVYDYDYKRQPLNEWIEMRDRKIRKRNLAEKMAQKISHARR